jgi:serine/threonine protein kinase
LCCGTLFEVIQNTYTGPALPTDREVLYQIAAGLVYIHSKELAHRDIKPENILISKESQIKLSEFGLKRRTKYKCYITGLKGALLWMAPEAIHEETDIEIAQKSDVFSCGCVFFVFLMRENDGMHPFGNITDHLQIYANIQDGNSINIHSKFSKRFMSKQLYNRCD